MVSGPIDGGSQDAELRVTARVYAHPIGSRPRESTGCAVPGAGGETRACVETTLSLGRHLNQNGLVDGYTVGLTRLELLRFNRKDADRRFIARSVEHRVS